MDEPVMNNTALIDPVSNDPSDDLLLEIPMNPIEDFKYPTWYLLIYNNIILEVSCRIHGNF
jgi:hypothetical protein